MARHGIFIGNQKITARYVGDKLVWKAQAQLPEKPAVGALAFEGTIHYIMVFKNNNFLDFFFYHDNQIANQAYKSAEINGVLFPIKNIRSYRTSVIGISGEGNFTSKKDDLTKAGFPLSDNYRMVDNPTIKLYK